MRFEHRLSYDASPDVVHEMLIDQAFRQKVATEMHTTRHLVTVDRTASGVVVVVDQTQHARRIPSFAKRFVGDEIQIVQTESWDSETHAGLEVAIPGKPGHLKGGIVLESTGAGTQETVTGDIKVPIPLIGGRLEGLIAQLLDAAMRTEERVGRSWLTGER
jgi:hypothetical protein